MRGGGYLRRKITYNIGKGGSRKASPDTPNITTGDAKDAIEKVIIVDEYGQTESSWDWISLYPDAYEHIDLVRMNGKVYHYYRIRAGPTGPVG